MANIVEKTQQELSSFEKHIQVVPASKETSVRFLGGAETDDYHFNQLETINRIDRYYNSQFDTGKLDGERQRKTFLNIVKFHADVAAKQTDIDVKDYTFIPDSTKDVDLVWILKRNFVTWTRQNQFGQLINDLNRDYSKYGTCVVKRVGKELERVPLSTLKCTQDARTLREAVKKGGYIIQEHELTPNEMREFPSWDVDQLSTPEDEQVTVYERYGLVSKGSLADYTDEEVDDDEKDEMVLAVAFVVLEKESEGIVLFAEEVSDIPYEEAHWDKQDGRWLGIGEVEIQFENQVARNLNANLRRRNALWGSKKVFQSADSDMVGKNLVREVADGEVLEVGPQGAISQVDMRSQHAVDFNQDEAVWQENSRQKSFTFEVNTGESLPSGTPFRLGVILSNASQTHFNLKRENFGFFLERSFFNHLLPIFEKDMNSKEHVLSIAMNEEGIERYRNAMLTHQANRRLKEKILDENLTRNLLTLDFSFEEELERVKEELQDEPYLFLRVGKNAFEDVHFHMELTITGEEIDLNKKIETLSNLFQVLPPEDPRRDQVLNRIMQLTGVDSGSLLKQEQQRGQLNVQELISQGNNQLNAGTTNTGAEGSAQGALQQ